MKSNETENKLNAWLNGQLSDEELKKSLGDSDLLKYKQIIEEVDRWVPNHEEIIFDPKEVPIRSIKEKSINAWIPVSIAASATLFISVFVWLYLFNGNTQYSTKVANIKEITLPDGISKVTLASNSKVSWNEDDWTSSHRKISLTGKAFFEVGKGSPFEVNTQNGKIEVIGTSFELEEFEEALNVICFEGTVRATANNNEVVLIQGGQRYLYYQGTWEDGITIEDVLPAWLEKKTKFEKAPLVHVIKSLEKLYDIEIVIGSINLKRRFTGTIPNENLETAISIVFKPLNISFELNGNKLYLRE